MARTLDAILAEVNKRSDPQRSIILKQVAELPKQQQAEEAGLRAQLDVANENILGSARQRGLGFSGIPVGEQAKYAATEFAPALARNAAQFSNRRASLNDALAGIGQDNYKTAYGIYGDELDRDFQAQQFAEQQRQFNEQKAASERAQAAQAASNNSIMNWLKNNQSANPTAPQPPPAPQNLTPPQTPQEKAHDFVRNMKDSGASPIEVVNDFNAAKAWYEKTGDQTDYYKLLFYREQFPDILGQAQFRQTSGLRF